LSQQDRERWNKKWNEMAEQPFGPHPLLLNNQRLFGGGKALDLACGRGQNAIWLAQQEYSVLAVDISDTALNLARSEAIDQRIGDRIHFELVDLDSWLIPQASFDLVCVFRFLSRQLFQSIRSSLLPEGLLCYATRHTGALEHYPAANRAYLLERGELLAEFEDWHVLHYEEGLIDAEIIARKVANE